MSLKLRLANLALSLLLAGNLLTPTAALAVEGSPSPEPTPRSQTEGFFSLRERVKEFISKPGKAAIGTGEVTAKDGTTLTITKNGKSYTVLTDGKTQFRRRFWGKSSLDEILVGHSVNIIGRWTDEAKTTIQARLVRDLSIQKRYGVFFGTVSGLNDNGWVMHTKRGDITVTVDGDTKIINRRGGAITKGDVLVGHRVRVRGLWDQLNNTLTKVAQVKDFSLPPSPSPAAK